MANAAHSSDLSGLKVLIVEDEFYLALDLKDSVERAGGTALGPFADAASGIAELACDRPDCAVVDVNLGFGPSFELPDALTAYGVPFIFLTGYDASIIPERFADVKRVQKPTDPVGMSMIIVNLCTSTAG